MDMESEIDAHQEPGLRHTCVVCELSFTTKIGMQKHQESHPGFKPYECSTCKKRFLSIKLLNTHGKWHLPRAHTCSVCEKSFVTSHHLLRHHMNTHLKQKKSKCGVCGKHFSSNSALKCHLATVHSEAKEFRCQVCEKPFKTPGRLRSHMQIHTKERLHRCFTCEKTFRKFTHLRRHMMRHYKFLGPERCKNLVFALRPSKSSGDQVVSESPPTRPEIVSPSIARAPLEDSEHRCVVCEKLFESTAALQRHQVRDHGIRILECPQSIGTFSDEQELEQSSLVHHRQTNGGANALKENLNDSPEPHCSFLNAASSDDDVSTVNGSDNED